VRKIQSEALDKVDQVGKWRQQKIVLQKPLALIQRKLEEGRAAHMAFEDAVAREEEPQTMETLSEEVKVLQFKGFSALLENTVFLADVLVRFPPSRVLLNAYFDSLFHYGHAYTSRAGPNDPALVQLLAQAKQLIDTPVEDIQEPQDDESGGFREIAKRTRQRNIAKAKGGDGDEEMTKAEKRRKIRARRKRKRV